MAGMNNVSVFQYSSDMVMFRRLKRKM